jgi:Ycf66 protein N-terminus
MVNAYLSWSSFVGIALAVSGAGLYFLRSLRPKLARDYDIFFSAVALLCGGILFFQGWRQDPILQFGQFLLTGSAMFFAVESIRLRGAATEQARRSTPIVDDERPVSRNYRATYQESDVEELSPYDEKRTPRRISGTRDARTNREGSNEEDVRSPRRPSPRANLDDRSSDRPSRRDPGTRPRAERGGSESPNNRIEDIRDDRSTGRRGTSGTRPDVATTGARSSKRPRPSDSAPRTRDRGVDDGTPAEYVDYRPVDGGDDENWGDS